VNAFLLKRLFTSAVSLILLIILVFFLVRLTGDPASLFLPVDASEEAREKFRELNGLNDPILVQFFRYIGDLAQLDFGTSMRRAEPAIDAVLRGFKWTLQLAAITIALVTCLSIIIGSLAAFRAGGIFDRIVTFFSLIGASAPDFWIAIVAIVIFFSKSWLVANLWYRQYLALDYAHIGFVYPALWPDITGCARLYAKRFELWLYKNRSG